MSTFLDPFRFVLTCLAGGMNQRYLQAIDYLREENRVLREHLGDRRLRLTDDQRRRLAAKAKRLGRKLLRDVATIVLHYHGERHHQGLGNRLILPDQQPTGHDGASPVSSSLAQQRTAGATVRVFGPYGVKLGPDRWKS